MTFSIASWREGDGSGVTLETERRRCRARATGEGADRCQLATQRSQEETSTNLAREQTKRGAIVLLRACCLYTLTRSHDDVVPLGDNNRRYHLSGRARSNCCPSLSGGEQWTQRSHCLWLRGAIVVNRDHNAVWSGRARGAVRAWACCAIVRTARLDLWNNLQFDLRTRRCRVASLYVIVIEEEVPDCATTVFAETARAAGCAGYVTGGWSPCEISESTFAN